MQKINKYYAKRALEYEKIYYRNDPIRQDEQKKIAEDIKKIFYNKKVLEVACGTGFWTVFLSETAKSITATDKSKEVLGIAKSKIYHCPVIFQKCDAYKLPLTASPFDAGLANFWFSHIPKNKIGSFFDGFHRVLSDKATVFICDNVFDESIGGKLVKDTRDENTYKIRLLENGDKYKILKNYYSRNELINYFSLYGNHLNIYYGNCFWYVCYDVNKKIKSIF